MLIDQYSPADLAESLFGDDDSAFMQDLARLEELIRERVAGSHILVVGGAGTIGSRTLEVLLDYRPEAVHVVDVNENGLAELVRDVRGRDWRHELPRLDFSPLELGSPLFRSLLADSQAFDHVLNYAALKHVRSEKSVQTSLRMLEVNFLGTIALRDALADAGKFPETVFSVSTDKAADPVNLMGASKRLMEAALFDLGWGHTSRTSARFANVAFSAGSLLEAWVLRLQKRQPLACPANTRRFMVTPLDAGRLCTLAAFTIPAGSVAIPSSQSRVREFELLDICAQVLERCGLRPEFFSDEAKAKSALPVLLGDRRYPVVVTQRDTAGEKEAEKFLGPSDKPISIGLESLDALTPARIAEEALLGLQDHLTEVIRGNRDITKSQLVQLLAALLPNFEHEASEQTLDDRM